MDWVCRKSINSLLACVGEKVNAKIQVPLGENEPQNLYTDYWMSLTLI